jgi:hypothetical protein
MSASIPEISLLLTLVVAGTSGLSGMSALSTEPLLEGIAPEKRLRSRNIPEPHRSAYRPSIRSKSGAVRRCFFTGLDLRRKLYFWGANSPIPGGD